MYEGLCCFPLLQRREWANLFLKTKDFSSMNQHGSACLRVGFGTALRFPNQYGLFLTPHAYGEFKEIVFFKSPYLQHLVQCLVLVGRHFIHLGNEGSNDTASWLTSDRLNGLPPVSLLVSHRVDCKCKCVWFQKSMLFPQRRPRLHVLLCNSMLVLSFLRREFLVEA